MEVWQDYQSGKFFTLDKNTGRQSPSDRFGSEQKIFTAYSTGFPRIISTKPVPIENLYKVQPKKFDGYCQFPRPSEKSSIKTPFIRSEIRTSKIHIKDESKIPKPLEFLSMSQNNNSPKRAAIRLTASVDQPMLNTIHDIKQSLLKKPLVDLRTATDLSIKLAHEKNNSTVYVRPKSKVKRRKLKNYFLKEFKTSGELFNIEKKIRQITNPEFFKKIQRLEKLDRALLEKKNAAKLLQNSYA